MRGSRHGPIVGSPRSPSRPVDPLPRTRALAKLGVGRAGQRTGRSLCDRRDDVKTLEREVERQLVSGFPTRDVTPLLPASSCCAVVDAVLSFQSGTPTAAVNGGHEPPDRSGAPVRIDLRRSSPVDHPVFSIDGPSSPRCLARKVTIVESIRTEAGAAACGLRKRPSDRRYVDVTTTRRQVTTGQTAVRSDG